MNWSDCSVIETVPGKLSGVAVIIHSRVCPDDLIVNRQKGAEWLAENCGLPLETVQSALSFHARHSSLASHPV